MIIKRKFLQCVTNSGISRQPMSPTKHYQLPSSSGLIPGELNCHLTSCTDPPMRQFYLRVTQSRIIENGCSVLTVGMYKRVVIFHATYIKGLTFLSKMLLREMSYRNLEAGLHANQTEIKSYTTFISGIRSQKYI